MKLSEVLLQNADKYKQAYGTLCNPVTGACCAVGLIGLVAGVMECDMTPDQASDGGTAGNVLMAAAEKLKIDLDDQLYVEDVIGGEDYQRFDTWHELADEITGWNDVHLTFAQVARRLQEYGL